MKNASLSRWCFVAIIIVVAAALPASVSGAAKKPYKPAVKQVKKVTPKPVKKSTSLPVKKGLSAEDQKTLFIAKEMNLLTEWAALKYNSGIVASTMDEFVIQYPTKNASNAKYYDRSAPLFAKEAEYRTARNERRNAGIGWDEALKGPGKYLYSDTNRVGPNQDDVNQTIGDLEFKLGGLYESYKLATAANDLTTANSLWQQMTPLNDQLRAEKKKLLASVMHLIRGKNTTFFLGFVKSIEAKIK